MAKISVVDAAKKAKMVPEEFLKKLKEYGVYAEDVQSTLDSQKISQIIKLVLAEESSSERKVEKRISSGVMRRRRASRVKKSKPLEEQTPVQEPEVPAVEPEVSIVEPEVPVAKEKEAEPEITEVEAVETEQPASVEEIEPVEEPKTEPEPDTPVVQVEEVQSGQQVEEPLEIVEPVQEPVAEPQEAPKEELKEEKEIKPEEEPAPVEEKPAEEPKVEAAVPKKEEPEKTAEAPAEKPAEKEKPKGKKKKSKTKKLPIRGVTKEPARIVALPDRKIETLKPVIPTTEEPAKKAAAPNEDAGQPRRGKKGRRVVEMGRKSGGGRKKKKEVYERDLRGGRGRKKKRELKSTEITTPKAIKRKIKIMEEVQVGDLAHRMGIKAGDLIRKLISMGVMATINQFIDYDTAAILAEEYGFEIENISVVEDDIFNIGLPVGEEGGEEVSRPPVVTIMGHVDHGKTTLLDTIRESNVVKREMGGITQHIGAYNVQLKSGKIVFLDTPGHETFTAMRARGAHVTDIVVLIVAADDGVMPQTIEAINHAKDASVPIIVAVNKIDKPNADPDRVKNELAAHDLIPEDWGGDTMFAHVSAKQNIGIEDLLEMILLQAEMMELKAVADRPAMGIILEARLEKGRGPVATVLVKEGTLKVGDPIVSDIFWGRVRSMQDDQGQKVDVATPSMPVEVVGLGGVPTAGSGFNSTKEERLAKQVAELREKKVKEEEQKKLSKVSLEDFYSTLEEGQVKELKLILKADVQGSVEAIIDAVQKKSTAQVKVKVIHSGAGAISETDINFAIASHAIVIGFNVRPEVKARALAERENIDIRLYEVIYDLVNDIEKALVGMLEPTYEEAVLGRVEVRDTFHISKLGTIAGCFVTDGKMVRNAKCRLIRDGVVIHKTKINSLKRFKDDAKEVLSGYECGIGLEGYNDIKVGDQIEAYEIHEVAPTLG